MAKSSTRTLFSPEIAISLVVLVIVLIWSYAHFFLIPYPGFRYMPPDGKIVTIFTNSPAGDPLKINDKLVQIDQLAWNDYYPDEINNTLFADLKPGDTIPLIVLRDGQLKTLSYVFPGPNRNEIISRLFDNWWLPYLFWFFGTAALLSLRPKDERRVLMAAFDFAIAIWLAVGGQSAFNVWKSPQVFTSAMWLFFPIAWHFNWVFPQSLKRLPTWFWVGLYLIGIGFAIRVWILPSTWNSYPIAALLAIAGGVVLTALHVIFQPQQRRRMMLLMMSVVLAIAPAALLNILRLSNQNNFYLQELALFVLPLIPLMFFFTVYRQQLGGMELRANRAITLILFGVILFTIALILIPTSNIIFTDPGAHLSFSLLMILLIGMGSALLYPSFQSWVERKLLGMPLPPTSLVENYTTQISTSLDTGQLVSLIRDEILPSLLIRQAAVLRLKGVEDESSDQPLKPILLEDINPSALPKPSEILPLLEQAGNYRVPTDDGHSNIVCPWIRVVLPLSAEGRTIGLCLLGRRDPDDYYAPNEISTIKAIMDQTALALVNIEQAERLHAFYQADIDRQEEERKSLARELHDDVLGQLAILAMSVDERFAGDAFLTAYQASVQRIREIISGLRPGLLNYGLYAALDELADDTASQLGFQSTNPGETDVDFELPYSTVRYPPEVELHTYRIVQQACKNAITHAHSNRITISGQLDDGHIDLRVTDDGIGFSVDTKIDLAELLHKKHFGLAGMYERAALIGGEVKITTARGQGTTIRVVWRED